VGLDIGTSGVRAAQLSIGKRGATLERFGQVALPPGAVVAGEVVDPPAVSASIKQLWSQARFSSKKVFAGVSNGKVIVRQVDLAYTPLPELRKSLPLQVQDVIPMPVEQAILDAHPLEEMVAEDGARGLRVLLVAAGRDMVAGHVAAIQGAGLTPAGIDLNSFALLRSLARPDEMGFGATAEALVDVGASVTNITVHQAGVARFVRILLMGGNDLTQSVAERMGVPMEQAEAAKQEHGLALPPDASGNPGIAALEAAAGSWVDEVRGSLDYYLSQPTSVRIRRIVISGGGCFLAGLAERLSATTMLSVEYGSVMSRMGIGRTGLTPEQLSYVDLLAPVPVGLALGAAA
jgi:type IV pilus assembly protein PilM